MYIYKVKSIGIRDELYLGPEPEKIEELPKIVPWVS